MFSVIASAMTFLCLVVSAEADELVTGPLDSDQNNPDQKSDSENIIDNLVKELAKIRDQIETKGVKVSLNEVLVQGIANNPELAAAFSQIQQQEWALIGAQREWYPKLDLSSGTTSIGYNWQTDVTDPYAAPRQTLAERGNPADPANPPPSPAKTSYKSNNFIIYPYLTVTWSFLDPSRQPTINSEAATLQQQKYLFAQSARGLILNLQKAYYQLQSSKQNIDSSRKILEINLRQLKIMEARGSIGMVTVYDIEQTKAQLFTQLSQLINYTNDYTEQTAELARLMALPKDSLAIPIESAAPQGNWSQPLSETLNFAVKHREEILSNLTAAESEKWSAVASLRKYLPVFKLTGTGSLYKTNGYSNVPVNQDPEFNYQTNRTWNASAGINFNWSIFDGGINAANAQSSLASSRRYLANVAKSEDQVIKEVRSSYGQMLTAKVGIDSARQALKSAQIAQTAARTRFEVGVGDITSVVQAITQLSTAAAEFSSQILNYNNAIAELYRYSATWPTSMKREIDTRIKSLRANPEP